MRTAPLRHRPPLIELSPKTAPVAEMKHNNVTGCYNITPSSGWGIAMALRSGACLVGGSAFALLVLSAGDGAAQTELPPVVVTAPSPIVRPRPIRPARVRTPAAPRRAAETSPPQPPAPAAPPAPPTLPLGALPIVTDQFATVTVVPNEELRRTAASTLGDLLFSKPGITGSSFAPGAASRPIIRGLDVNRVGIVENGVGAGGVSDLGEDHFVPVTPLVSNQIEVIRGPATLRYGSQSIGGVVSAANNRIPDALPACRDVAAPRQNACLNVETRGATTSVDNGLE